MSGGWLAVQALLLAAPLSDCPEQQQALKALVRHVVVRCQVPAIGDSDVGPLPEEDWKTWIREGAHWRRKSEMRFGRGCSPAFVLETKGCDWLLVQQGGWGSVQYLVAYASPGLSGPIDARVAKLLGLPLASPEDPRDALATSLALQKFTVVKGLAPPQRASLAGMPCVSDPEVFCGVAVAAVDVREQPIAQIDLGSSFDSAARITFGNPVRTGFWSFRGPVETPLHIRGRCLRATNLTLSLDTGLWAPESRGGCEALGAP